MADVCGLIRIDGCMLDDGFCRSPARPGEPPRREAIDQEIGSLQKKVEIPIRRRRHTPNAAERTECLRDFLRDGPRRLSKPPGQLERHGSTQIAELAIRWILEPDGRPRRFVERIERRQQTCEMRAQFLLDGQNHSRFVMAEWGLSICAWSRAAVRVKGPAGRSTLSEIPPHD